VRKGYSPRKMFEKCLIAFVVLLQRNAIRDSVQRVASRCAPGYEVARRVVECLVEVYWWCELREEEMSRVAAAYRGVRDCMRYEAVPVEVPSP